jgi:hypothetical protein
MRSIVERESWPGFERWDMKCWMLLVGPIIERIGTERLNRGRV